MKKIILFSLLVFSKTSLASCLTPSEMNELLSQKFEQGQEIIRRSKLEGVTWNLASFYKSKPEEIFQHGERCGISTTFYTSLNSAVIADQLIVQLNASDFKWAFYSNDAMMELVKYTHNGLSSRGIRCKIVDTASDKEKIICRNSGGAGKVAYSCFVKNLTTEAVNCSTH